MTYLCIGQGTPLPIALAGTNAVLAPYEPVTTALLPGRDTKHVWQEMDETEECIQAVGTLIQVFGTSIQLVVHIHDQHLQLYRNVEARYVSHNRWKWSWLHHYVIQGATRAHRALARRLLQAHWGWCALTRSFATRCQSISLLWEATCASNYGVMTMLVGATSRLGLPLRRAARLSLSHPIN